MQTATAMLEQSRHRLAQHYLRKLQQASSAITRTGAGNRSHWIRAVQQDWSQIKHWLDWSAQAAHSDGARMCIDFCTTAAAATTTQQTTAETIATLQQGLKAARTLSDLESEGEILYMLGLNHLRLQQFLDTRAHARSLLDCGEKLQNQPMIGRAWYLLACVSTSSGSFAEAEAQYMRSRELLEAQDPKDMVAVWAGFGHVAFFQGNYLKSREYHTKSMEQALLLGDEANAAVANLSLTGVFLQLRDLNLAMESAREALRIARKLSFLPLIPHSLTMLANVHRQLGQLTEARTYYEEVLGITRATLSPDSVISALTGLGRVMALQSDTEAAAAHFVDALKIAQENGILIRIPPLAEELVRIHLSDDDSSAARDYLGTLVTSAQSLKSVRFYARAVLVAAELMHREGDAEQAAQWIGLLQKNTEHLEPAKVTELRDELSTVLSEEQFAQAVVSGQRLILEETVGALADLLN